MERQKPKKRNRKKAAVLLLILLVLLAAAAYLGFTYLRAENIHVQGNKEKTEEYILNLSGIKPGTHLLNINKNTVAKNLEQDPFLRLKSIDITLPDKVVVNVTERERGAAVLFSGNFIVLDKDGNILEIKDAMDTDSNYPMIAGLNVTAFDLGAQLRVDDPYKLTIMEQVIAGLKEYNLLEKIGELDLSNVNAIKMLTRDGRTINFGTNERIQDKMQWIYDILPILDKENKQKGTIDVTAREFATYAPDEGEDNGGKDDQKKPEDTQEPENNPKEPEKNN